MISTLYLDNPDWSFRIGRLLITKEVRIFHDPSVRTDPGTEADGTGHEVRDETPDQI